MVIAEPRPGIRESRYSEDLAIANFHQPISKNLDLVHTWEGRATLIPSGCDEIVPLLDYEGWTAVVAELSIPEALDNRISILAGVPDIRYGDSALVTLSAYHHQKILARNALGVDWRNCVNRNSIIFRHPDLINKLDRFRNFITIPKLTHGIEKGYRREDADGQLKIFLNNVLQADAAAINKKLEFAAQHNWLRVKEDFEVLGLTDEERKILEEIERKLVSLEENQEFKQTAFQGEVPNKDIELPTIDPEQQLVSRLASLAGIVTKNEEKLKKPIQRKSKNYRGVPEKGYNVEHFKKVVKGKKLARLDLEEGLEEYPQSQTVQEHDENEEDSDTREEINAWMRTHQEREQKKERYQEHKQPPLTGEALEKAKKETKPYFTQLNFERENNRKRSGR